MKRYSLIALMLLSTSTGCIFGRSSGQPGFFTGVYNRIHGNNTGAPCASGMCGQAMPMPAPMMPMNPQAIYNPGCESCGGTQSMSYPEYTPSYETYPADTIETIPLQSTQPVPSST